MARLPDLPSDTALSQLFFNEQVEGDATWFSLPGGGVLFEPGEAADQLYFLRAGRLGALAAARTFVETRFLGAVAEVVIAFWTRTFVERLAGMRRAVAGVVAAELSAFVERLLGAGTGAATAAARACSAILPLPCATATPWCRLPKPIPA